MSEHPEDDAGWDDPEQDEDEDEDEREAQAEDPTSPTRGFDDLDDLEEFEAEQDK
jgi:hypothetical protein